MDKVNLTKKTINLTKGQVINLSKASSDLSKVMIALGWDEAKNERVVTRTIQPGFIGRLFGAQPRQVTETVRNDKGYDYDLDAWVAFLNNGNLPGNKVEDNVVYYGRLDAGYGSNNYAHHKGDDLVGGGIGDNEQIIVNLDNVPNKYNEILIGVTIYCGYKRDQTFGDIQNTFVRLVDLNDNFEMCRYDDKIGQEWKNCYTFIVGLLHKNGLEEWDFKSIGYGTKDKSIGEAIASYSIENRK